MSGVPIVTDLEAVGLFAALLATSVAVGEGLRMAGWSPESTRRVVHAGVGLVTAASPMWFDGPGGIYLLAVAFMVGNAIMLWRGWGPSMHAIERRSFGTVIFPFALVVALYLCWTLDPSRVFVLQIAFAVLAVADPAASWVGTSVSSPGPYHVAGATKTVAGSLAFGIFAFAITIVLLVWIGPGWSALEVGAAALSVAALSTVAEALGRGGWDNLWIVLAVVVVLSALEADEAFGLHLAAVASAVVFGVLTFRVGALDVSGAMAGSVLAWMLVALGGVAWAAPALAFFVLSSGLSRVGESRKTSSRTLEAKGSRRDMGQVLANGGVGMVVFAATVFWDVEWLYLAFVGAFAAAAADTWGTELGTAVGGATRRLGIGRRVQPGESGGMSVAGTVGAVAGATTVVGSAMLVGGITDGLVAVAITAAAVGASVLDSALGATVQARFHRPDGTLSEVALEGDLEDAAHVGWVWVDNDVVNWAGSLAGAAGAVAAWSFVA